MGVGVRNGFAGGKAGTADEGEYYPRRGDSDRNIAKTGGPRKDARQHPMLPEHYRLAPEGAETVARTIREGGRVVSVGTTSTRALETLARQPGGLGPGEGWTSLYICPGHEFRAVSGLITNFHLPKSTPLFLAAAFAGRESLLAAYREAFRERYRLYSYGDAMLVL